MHASLVALSLLFNLTRAAYVQPAVSLEPYSLGLKARSDPLIDCLEAYLSKDATVETTTASTFANDTARYSSLFSPTFQVVVKVATEQDVVEAVGLTRLAFTNDGLLDWANRFILKVRCATQTNTKFLATAPRHGFSTSLTEIQQGLQIDISHFNQVSVDSGANTMTIGGAVQFQQVIDALYAQGKEIRQFSPVLLLQAWS